MNALPSYTELTTDDDSESHDDDKATLIRARHQVTCFIASAIRRRDVAGKNGKCGYKERPIAFQLHREAYEVKAMRRIMAVTVRRRG